MADNGERRSATPRLTQEGRQQTGAGKIDATWDAVPIKVSGAYRQDGIIDALWNIALLTPLMLVAVLNLVKVLAEECAEHSMRRAEHSREQREQQQQQQQR